MLFNSTSQGKYISLKMPISYSNSSFDGVMTFSITVLGITTFSITILGITTFSIKILGITTFSIVPLSITTFSIVTLSVKYITETLSINDIIEIISINDMQHNSTSAIVLNVIVLSVMINLLLC